MFLKWTYAILVLMISTQLLVAEDAAKETTKTPVTKAPVDTTTAKPLVNVTASTLCSKCICDAESKQLDCNNKQMSNWFTAHEWNTLQNGDIKFEIIKMEHNNLTTIPQLPDYPVKSLYLGFNQIASISKAAFANLTDLEILDLSHNNLTSKALDPDVFKGQYSPGDYLPLKNLRELVMGYNELHTLDPDLFEHVPKLEVLVLCKNIFHVIDHPTETAIATLLSLKTLDLSYMELDELPDNLLHGPRDLETLILTGNLLDEIPDHLELAINLKELVLDENPIGDIAGENVFPTLKKLEYLSISYMPELKIIGPGGLSNLQSLKTLAASNNPKLHTIDIVAFSKNTTNPEIFDFPPLEKLYLHNNNLSQLDRGLLVRWDKITTIDLRYNPWSCDCANSWLIHVLMTQINNASPLLAKNIECAVPVAWKSKPVLDLNTHKTELICDEGAHPEKDSLILVGLLIGLLMGIPITIGTLILYRRGCFGLRNRGNSGVADRALYNRASFTDDFHI